MPLDFAAALADRLDPPEPAVFETLGYEPACVPYVKGLAAERCGKCPQEQFAAATEFDQLIGGAAGGGKTKSLLMVALRECVRHPGLRVGAFRRSYPELKESLLAELAEVGFASALGAQWNGTEYELRFPNGSLMMFRYAETIKDATRRQGGQYQLLIFDERTLTPPDVIAFLESRLRSGRASLPVIGIKSSANPGGPGHGSVRSRYIEPTNYGEKTYTDERGRTIRFVPAKLADNPYINPEYAADLKALPERLRRAFLDGDWSAFEGQMFTELSAERHRVKPFTLPPSWQRYVGVDWGFRAPWAVGWFALDEDGRIWVYREIYETQVGEADQAKRILAAEAEDEHIVSRFADDAMWATRGDAKEIAAVYAGEGCHLTPAGKGPGSRISGWQRIHSYLAEAPACPHHRGMGWATCPRMHVFTTCPKWFEELSNLPHAQTGNPEDADTRAPDHLADLTRYVLLNLGGGPDWTILDEEKPSEIAEALGSYQPLGVFAYRPGADEPVWFAGDEDVVRRTVRTAGS